MSRSGVGAINVAAALLLAAVGAARAQDAGDESPFHAFARVLGLASGPQNTADFVKESRPETPVDAIPVFSDPKEPSSTVLSPDSLKAKNAELDAAVEAHKKLRAAEGVPDDATQPKSAAKPEAKKKKDATSAKN
jgi:hypothetical protein